MDFDPHTDEKPLQLPAYQYFLSVAESRPNHAHDKPSADFIQRYGMAAVQCFIEKENPTMALMALTPFNLGEVSLANELNTLLFDHTKTAEQIITTLETTGLDRILQSINRFHQDKNNDAYLVQTTIALQMFMYAALTRASSLDHQRESQFKEILLNKLTSLGLNPATTFPARKLFNADAKPGEGKIVEYQCYFDEVGEVPKPTAETKKVSETQASSSQLVSDADIYNNFQAAYNLAESNQFHAQVTPLMKFEETLQLAKQVTGNFLTVYFSAGTRGNHTRSRANLYGILNYLVDLPTSPEKQAFALAALNKIIEQDAFQATVLFTHKDSELFKAILTLKPRHPQVNLELGKLFKTLAGYQQAYQSEFRALFNARMEGRGMKTDNNKNLGEYYITGGVLLSGGIVAAVISVLSAMSILFPPLFALYATTAVLAGIFGTIGLAVLGWGGIQNKLNQFTSASTEGNDGPLPTVLMIQTNLNTWLEAHGYYPPQLSESAFIDLLKKTPYLVQSIDPNNDKNREIFKRIFEKGNWNTFEKLAATFDRDQWKLRLMVIFMRTGMLRNLITNLEQLKTFCDFLPTREDNPDYDKARCKAFLWQYFLNEDNKYTCLQTLIDNTPKTIPVDKIGSGGTTFSRNIAALDRTTIKQDPYDMLINIFRDHEDEIIALKANETPSQHPSPLAAPVQTVARKVTASKAPPPTVLNTDEDEDEDKEKDPNTTPKSPGTH